MFSGKDVPAVGVSIGIERVFAIAEAQARARAAESGTAIRATETQVLVASIGNGMQVGSCWPSVGGGWGGVHATRFPQTQAPGRQPGLALKEGLVSNKLLSAAGQRGTPCSQCGKQGH